MNDTKRVRVIGLPTNVFKITECLVDIRKGYLAQDQEAMRNAYDSGVAQLKMYYEHFTEKPRPKERRIPVGIDTTRSYRMMLALHAASMPDEAGLIGRHVQWVADQAGIQTHETSKVLRLLYQQGFVQRCKHTDDTPMYFRWYSPDNDFAAYMLTDGAKRQQRITEKLAANQGAEHA